MIVYPKEWRKHYEELSRAIEFSAFDIEKFIDILRKVLINSISSREDHPDILFARQGSNFYSSVHHEFIVEPNDKESDEFAGDNAVRQLFEEASQYTNEIICGDGIDEFVCGYYAHMSQSQETYEYYLSRLLPDHLIPLNNASMYTHVFLPYLDGKIIDINRNIPLTDKADHAARKKTMIAVAANLGVPIEIIERNKYGFCDAFRKENK
jgi:asparagine synthetase B (glutamine-hydrolysing)